jgi:hypothetical protein
MIQSSAKPNAVREPQANTDRIRSAKEAPNLPPCLGVAET